MVVSTCRTTPFSSSTSFFLFFFSFPPPLFFPLFFFALFMEGRRGTGQEKCAGYFDQAWKGEGKAYGSELCLRCSGVEEMLARLSAFGLFLR